MTAKARRATFLIASAILMLTAARPALAADADRAKAKANFVQADSDGDGRLNYREFVTFVDLNAAQGLGRAATIRRLNAYKRAFEQLDSNRDSTISQQELAAQVQRQSN